MTEKRFMLDDAGEVIDLQTAKFIEYSEEIVECLNTLHEENQKLLTLSNMKKGALVEAVKDLIKENEQLKSELKSLRKKYNDFSDAVDKRLKEMMG